MPVYLQTKPLDRIARKIGKLPVIFCPVCGNTSQVIAIKENLRESCLCTRCRSSNRQRQLAYMLCRSLSSIKQKRIRCLRDIIGYIDLFIYNTECERAIHNNLSGMKNYICSEYCGSKYKSGNIVNGMLHEDLMDLSFDDESIDIVLSSDVLEHVSRPYDAHREIWRVLKPNGRHIFTVPFHPKEFLDETRAAHDENGELRLIKEPLYHGDPLRSDGALVYTIFSLQMLAEMKKIGFRTNLYHLYKPLYGILGAGVVFDAIKVQKKFTLGWNSAGIDCS